MIYLLFLVGGVLLIQGLIVMLFDRNVFIGSIAMIILGLPLIFFPILYNNRITCYSIIFCLFYSSFFLCLIIFFIASKIISKSRNITCKTVLILGETIYKKKLSANLVFRLKEALTIYTNNNCMFYLAGGVTKGNEKAEAFYMKDYLVKHGVTPMHIVTESESINTYENFINFRNLVDINQPFICITSSYHIPRAYLVSRCLDIKCCFYAAETYLFSSLNYYVQELLGFILYLMKYYYFR